MSWASILVSRYSVGTDQLVDLGFLHVANMLGSDTAALFNDQFATEFDIKACVVSPRIRSGTRPMLISFSDKIEIIGLKEDIQHFLIVQTECAQNDCDWQFSAAIDTGKHTVFGIEFKIEP